MTTTHETYVVLYDDFLDPAYRQNHIIGRDLTLIGRLTIPGEMYDLGERPGLIPVGDRQYDCAIFQATGELALPWLDEHHGYDISDEAHSRFIRGSLVVPELGVVWVYFLAEDHVPEQVNLVPSGLWIEHRLNRAASA